MIGHSASGTAHNLFRPICKSRNLSSARISVCPFISDGAGCIRFRLYQWVVASVKSIGYSFLVVQRYSTTGAHKLSTATLFLTTTKIFAEKIPVATLP